MFSSSSVLAQNLDLVEEYFRSSVFYILSIFWWVLNRVVALPINIVKNRKIYFTSCVALLLYELCFLMQSRRENVI